MEYEECCGTRADRPFNMHTARISTDDVIVSRGKYIDMVNFKLGNRTYAYQLKLLSMSSRSSVRGEHVKI